LIDSGLGERLRRDGMVHRGIQLLFERRLHHLDFDDLCDSSITVYGQQEVIKDLVHARLAAGGALHFSVEELALHGLDGERPRIRYRAMCWAHDRKGSALARRAAPHAGRRHGGLMRVRQRRRWRDFDRRHVER
jgi:hypothetical protein